MFMVVIATSVPDARGLIRFVTGVAVSVTCSVGVFSGGGRVGPRMGASVGGIAVGLGGVLFPQAAKRIQIIPIKEIVFLFIISP
jgi:hypothetical protein